MYYLTICIIAVCYTKHALSIGKKSDKKIDIFIDKLLGSDKFIELAQKFADEVAVKMKTVTSDTKTDVRSHRKDKSNTNKSSSTEAQESDDSSFKRVKVNARDIIENIKNISSDNLELKFKNIMKKIQRITNISKETHEPIDEIPKETDASDESNDDNQNNETSDDTDVEMSNKGDKNKYKEHEGVVKGRERTKNKGSSSSDTEDTSKSIELKKVSSKSDSSKDKSNLKGKQKKQQRSQKRKDAAKKSHRFRNNIISFMGTVGGLKNSTEEFSNVKERLENNSTTNVTIRNIHSGDKRGTSVPGLRTEGEKTFAYMPSPEYQEYHEMAKKHKEKDQDYFSIINE